MSYILSSVPGWENPGSDGLIAHPTPGMWLVEDDGLETGSF